AMEFVVNEETAVLLNNFALSIFEHGEQPWLDCCHLGKDKMFNVSYFEFVKGEGVFCHGTFTPLGLFFYDAGRISGISITTSVVKDNGKLYDAMLTREISAEEVPPEGSPKKRHDVSLMGAVLIDGRKSAIEPA